QIGDQYGFQIGNIFHAGDGNLHPIVLFDPRDKKQFERALQAAAEIIRHCVEIGGALTGEHGVGMEKSELMPLLFSDADFALIGASRVLTDRTQRAIYAVDDMVPSVVAKPSSAEEAAEIVRFAAREKLALIPYGARTKLRVGMPPSRYDIALDMTALNQIPHY